MHELSILQDQFADLAKRYPGLECCVIGWHKSCREAKKQGGEDAADCPITLPQEYRCSASDCIGAWEHFPCNADHLISDSHREYLSEWDLAAYKDECEERVSWRKKTLLMRRTGETWKKETAFGSLATLTDRTMPCVRRWNTLSHSAYFDVESELKVYAEGTWSDQEDRGPRTLDLIRWLWLLFLVNRNQRVCVPYGGGGGYGPYLESLPRRRERRWPYAMKIDDVFLESAFLCGLLLNAGRECSITIPRSKGEGSVGLAQEEQPDPKSPVQVDKDTQAATDLPDGRDTPLEPKTLLLHCRRLEAEYEGNLYPLSERQTEFLRGLIDGNGAWILGKQLRSHGDERLDKVKKALPGPLQVLIESQTRKGYRLTVPTALAVDD